MVVSIAACANSQNALGQGRTQTQLYKEQLSTGQVVSDTFVGSHLQGADNLVSEGVAGWVLVGVGDFRHNGDKGLVYPIVDWRQSFPMAGLAAQSCGTSIPGNARRGVDSPSSCRPEWRRSPGCSLR